MLRADQTKSLDFDDIHQFAPKLSCREIALTCAVLQLRPDLTTTEIIDYVSGFRESNIELGHVEEVTFDDLQGMDAVIEALRINLLMPLLEKQLARELDLHPKRGVLLYGPPGTGKTSIGRALAHELGSKFFLIDGEAADRECNFGQYVFRLFKKAERNAPSVVFIDDSDILFKHGDDDDSRTLYRHLLSQLDGIHSKGKGDVCVMLTAMDVRDLPPALIRSGRVELWLEVRPPDRAAREAILRQRCAPLLKQFPLLDLARVAEATADFTGADLRRLVGDAKNRIAYRILGNGEKVDETEEFLLAVRVLNDDRERYTGGRAGFLNS